MLISRIKKAFFSTELEEVEQLNHQWCIKKIVKSSLLPFQTAVSDIAGIHTEILSC